VRPCEMGTDCTHHTDGFCQQILLLAGRRRENHVIGKRQDKVQAAGLPHRARGTQCSQLAEGLGPSMELDVVDIQEEVCVGVLMREGRDVAKPLVVYVRLH